ncbi:MAG TPA: multiheme c-type cytochrome [Enhygromyxa sp.]|nr:multiheme c-type cytochrome [Enhygromyxa sp.]
MTESRSSDRPTRTPTARIHQWALATQFALGGYLWLVPDDVFFLGTQVVVLLHVLTALLWLPLFVWWLGKHILRPAPRVLRRVLERGRTRGLINGAFLLSVALALATGVWVIARSEGMPAATAHALTGATVVVLLLIHYAIEARRHLVRSSVAVVGIVIVAVALRFVAPALTPERTFEDESLLAPEAAYDEAAWCGSCHEDIYAEWRTSAHGRALIDRNILDELEEEAHERPINLDADLEFFRAVAAGDEQAKARIGGARLDPCVHCHAPTSFYGDSQQPLLTATDSAGDGITCSFCHTLQGVDASGVADMSSAKLRELAASGAFSDLERLNALLASRMPTYESKPQRVRRYLFQNSDNQLARTIGDYLIRWRPEVHRRDYHPEFLGSSEACQACHGSGGQADEIFHQTYPDWADSRFAGDDEHPRVDCQDCHMVRELTGGPHREPGKHVPWGPERASRRSHFLLGGNVSHIDPAHLPEYTEAQRQLRAKALELWVDDVAIDEAGAVRVKVGLRNRHVGHDFPGHETPVRFAWLRVEARDAQGNVLASTPVFEGRPDEGDVPPQVIVYYRRVEGLDIKWDTSLPPDGSRVDEVTLALPPKTEVAEIVAYLHANTDPHAPALVARRDL